MLAWIQRAAGLAAILGLMPGCGIGPDTCSRPESDLPTAYKGGSVTGGTYMSSPWDGDLLHFPGGAYYNVFHRLVRRPSTLNFYLSFERNGITDASVAQAAGNQVEVKWSDCASFTIVNGSCAEYWLLAVASVGDDDICRPDDAVAIDATSDGSCLAPAIRLSRARGWIWDGSGCRQIVGECCHGADCLCVFAAHTKACCQERVAICTD